MVLETKRLLLRKPLAEDFQAYWLMKNDAESTKYTGGITPYSREERFEMFRSEWVDAEQDTEFSIVLKAGGEYLGYGGFVGNGGAANELLYGIKRGAWGQGYATEAAAALLRYGFTVLRHAQIVATVNPENIASERVLQKIAMEFDRRITEAGIPLHKYKLDAPAHK